MNSKNNLRFEVDLARRRGCMVVANSDAAEGAVLKAYNRITAQDVAGEVAIGQSFECPGCQIKCSIASDPTGKTIRAEFTGECGILESTIRGEM